MSKQFCDICGKPGAVDCDGISLCPDGSCDNDPAAREVWEIQQEREHLQRELHDLDHYL